MELSNREVNFLKWEKGVYIRYYFDEILGYYFYVGQAGGGEKSSTSIRSRNNTHDSKERNGRNSSKQQAQYNKIVNYVESKGLLRTKEVLKDFINYDVILSLQEHNRFVNEKAELLRSPNEERAYLHKKAKYLPFYEKQALIVLHELLYEVDKENARKRILNTNLPKVTSKYGRAYSLDLDLIQERYTGQMKYHYPEIAEQVSRVLFKLGAYPRVLNQFTLAREAQEKLLMQDIDIYNLYKS